MSCRFFLLRPRFTPRLGRLFLLLLTLLGLSLLPAPPVASQSPPPAQSQWDIAVVYTGTVTDPLTITGQVLYNNPTMTVSNGTQQINFGINASVPLSQLNPTTSSQAGTSGAELKVSMMVQGIGWMSGQTGSLSHPIQTNGAGIEFHLTWKPKNNDPIADPAPTSILLTYRRTLQAHGKQIGPGAVTATGQVQSSALTNAQDTTLT